ncbi:hypothetical protein FQA39_LY17207 [Lamprigera yunnana]|nr:hypothetical protein FQA39_LY17207 [Lamprigera yunnana]
MGASFDMMFEQEASKKGTGVIKEERKRPFLKTGQCQKGICGKEAACLTHANNTYSCICPHDKSPPTKDWRCTRITVDSVSTSCIQLAKQRIIKYSDQKYNINDFNTGDCETMLLNQIIYYLNTPKSKWISVGLYYPFEFASVVKIFGRYKQYVIFKEDEWIQFHEQRENINRYFQTCDIMLKPRQIGSKTLTFEMIAGKKILRIEGMCGNEVYLDWESVSEV